MPRRRQRFSDLERQFRQSGGVAADDSPLGRYIKFKKGETKITVTQKLTAAQRKRYAFGILPFNISLESTTPAAEDYYSAPITAYSNDGRKAASLNLVDTDLGYEDVDTNTKQEGNFYSALLRVFVKDSAAATTVTKKSAITGNDYERYAGKSFSIPFGRNVKDLAPLTLQTVGEEDVRNKLTNLAKSRPAVSGVSYEPEVFRTGNPILSSPPA